MALLATAFAVGLILLNLTALALVGTRVTRHYLLARAATPVAAALVVFFFEHFVGAGRLTWCWPITTAVSVWVVLRNQSTLRTHWRTEAVFLASFAWAFSWRFTYPGIVASSEKLADLAMISSYLPGTRLPPIDAWLPPYPFDVYYSFQHYAAALLGRLFGLTPGLTYQVAFSLVVALTILCAAGCAFAISRSKWGTALVVAAFALGGTGASIPVHFIVATPTLHTSMRFIGDTIGTMKLPSETFAYLTALGDYHPPLSGFYLLAFALLCVALIETAAETRVAQSLLTASIPVCAIANGWTLPLQGMLVVTWIAYRKWDRRPVDWRMLTTGFFVAATLCYPFFSRFASHAGDYNLALRFVPIAEHTPMLLGAMVLWPIVAAVALSFVYRERTRWLLWFATLWLVLLVASELLYVDDVYSGVFNRFNTTLKWWPWIQAGALLLAGAFGVSSKARVGRYATIILLAVVALYGVDLGRALITGPKGDLGRVDGAAWITNDRIERVILEYLSAQPRGVVLQRLEAGAFTPAPGLVLFAGQQAFLGWPEHEKLWRGQRADIGVRDAQLKQFYAGMLPNSAEWLTQNRIAHILWLKTEAKLPAGTFDAIDRQIRSEYFWREYYRVGEFRVGVWSRRIPPPSHP